jgi:Ca2+-binding EF-hand superfamily protein
MLPLLSALALPAVTAAALADDPQQTPAPASHQTRVTWQERFAKANAAGDGHLTLEEAKTGFPLVAKHFTNIDVDGKGYITEGDLRTWYALRKVARGLRSLPEGAAQPSSSGEQPGANPAKARFTASADE